MTSFKVTRIEGVVTMVRCGGCGAEGIAGSIPYVSAATGEAREPEEWYRDEGMGLSYCGTCAPKLMQEDPTRSVNNFYTDTAGTKLVLSYYCAQYGVGVHFSHGHIPHTRK